MNVHGRHRGPRCQPGQARPRPKPQPHAPFDELTQFTETREWDRSGRAAEFERHVFEALGLVEEPCFCGDPDSEHDEPWLHTARACFPQREMVGGGRWGR